jgi:hypothetical protein
VALTERQRQILRLIAERLRDLKRNKHDIYASVFGKQSRNNLRKFLQRNEPNHRAPNFTFVKGHTIPPSSK